MPFSVHTSAPFSVHSGSVSSGSVQADTDMPMQLLQQVAPGQYILVNSSAAWPGGPFAVMSQPGSSSASHVTFLQPPRSMFASVQQPHRQCEQGRPDSMNAGTLPNHPQHTAHFPYQNQHVVYLQQPWQGSAAPAVVPRMSGMCDGNVVTMMNTLQASQALAADMLHQAASCGSAGVVSGRQPAVQQHGVVNPQVHSSSWQNDPAGSSVQCQQQKHPTRKDLKSMMQSAAAAVAGAGGAGSDVGASDSQPHSCNSHPAGQGEGQRTHVSTPAAADMRQTANSGPSSLVMVQGAGAIPAAGVVLQHMPAANHAAIHASKQAGAPSAVTAAGVGPSTPVTEVHSHCGSASVCKAPDAAHHTCDAPEATSVCTQESPQQDDDTDEYEVHQSAASGQQTSNHISKHADMGAGCSIAEHAQPGTAPDADVNGEKHKGPALYTGNLSGGRVSALHAGVPSGSEGSLLPSPARPALQPQGSAPHVLTRQTHPMQHCPHQPAMQLPNDEDIAVPSVFCAAYTAKGVWHGSTAHWDDRWGPSPQKIGSISTIFCPAAITRGDEGVRGEGNVHHDLNLTQQPPSAEVKAVKGGAVSRAVCRLFGPKDAGKEAAQLGKQALPSHHKVATNKALRNDMDTAHNSPSVGDSMHDAHELSECSPHQQQVRYSSQMLSAHQICMAMPKGGPPMQSSDDHSQPPQTKQGSVVQELGDGSCQQPSLSGASSSGKGSHGHSNHHESAAAAVSAPQAGALPSLGAGVQHNTPDHPASSASPMVTTDLPGPLQQQSAVMDSTMVSGHTKDTCEVLPEVDLQSSQQQQGAWNPQLWAQRHHPASEARQPGTQTGAAATAPDQQLLPPAELSTRGSASLQGWHHPMAVAAQQLTPSPEPQAVAARQAVLMMTAPSGPTCATAQAAASGSEMMGSQPSLGSKSAAAKARTEVMGSEASATPNALVGQQPSLPSQQQPAPFQDVSLLPTLGGGNGAVVGSLAHGTKPAAHAAIVSGPDANASVSFDFWPGLDLTLHDDEGDDAAVDFASIGALFADHNNNKDSGRTEPAAGTTHDAPPGASAHLCTPAAPEPTAQGNPGSSTPGAMPALVPASPEHCIATPASSMPEVLSQHQADMQQLSQHESPCVVATGSQPTNTGAEILLTSTSPVTNPVVYPVTTTPMVTPVAPSLPVLTPPSSQARAHVPDPGIMAARQAALARHAADQAAGRMFVPRRKRRSVEELAAARAARPNWCSKKHRNEDDGRMQEGTAAAAAITSSAAPTSAVSAAANQVQQGQGGSTWMAQAAALAYHGAALTPTPSTALLQRVVGPDGTVAFVPLGTATADAPGVSAAVQIPVGSAGVATAAVASAAAASPVVVQQMSALVQTPEVAVTAPTIHLVSNQQQPAAVSGMFATDGLQTDSSAATAGKPAVPVQKGSAKSKRRQMENQSAVPKPKRQRVKAAGKAKDCGNGNMADQSAAGAGSVHVASDGPDIPNCSTGINTTGPALLEASANCNSNSKVTAGATQPHTAAEVSYTAMLISESSHPPHTNAEAGTQPASQGAATEQPTLSAAMSQPQSSQAPATLNMTFCRSDSMDFLQQSGSPFQPFSPVTLTLQSSAVAGATAAAAVTMTPLKAFFADLTSQSLEDLLASPPACKQPAAARPAPLPKQQGKQHHAAPYVLHLHSSVPIAPNQSSHGYCMMHAQEWAACGLLLPHIPCMQSAFTN